MRERVYFVYILASRRNGTLYTGVTNDVMRRTWEHKGDIVRGFTKKYGVHVLVWYELDGDIGVAIARKADQRLEPRVEDQDDRKAQFRWNDLYARLLGEIALPELPGSPSLASR